MENKKNSKIFLTSRTFFNSAAEYVELVLKVDQKLNLEPGMR